MKKTTMHFLCNEDINRMPRTECGRYCASCEREIIDFRGASKQQVEALRGKDVCGIFLPEQVEDGITPIQLPKARFVAATFLTFLGLETHAQSEISTTQPVPTEIVANDSTDLTPVETIEQKTEKVNALSKEQVKQIKRLKRQFRPIITTNKGAYYWSRRFPFIVRRRVFRGGKF